MKTLKERSDAISLGSMNTYGAPENPDMADMDGWTVLLKRLDTRKQMTTPFYMGRAICKEPGALEVLDCLITDAASVEIFPSFADWAIEMGYEDFSQLKTAERTFKACERIRDRLRKFLGAEYEAFLWETERL